MDTVGILKRHWGYDRFRPLQKEIVDSVIEGRDTLGLMPTGGGKSITFQVPGMMMEGITLVVTPLISLMKDQVDNLQRRHIKAVALHSGLSRQERDRAREKLMNGGAKFLYVSPERLRNDSFIELLRLIKVNLIVVDEAHCISQWGYDFRPAYLNIRQLRKEKPGVAVLALTATATPEVAQDICRQLNMTNPRVFRMSFTRENISYVVRPSETKINEVFHILSRTTGTAIVYVRNRRRTAEIADYLHSTGIKATGYHAGLSQDLKEERQNKWKSGEIRVMVATNAFGMGIDKPDVRVVIHYDLPPSLEEYYQEAGRAGRDGKTSYAVLLTSRTDTALLRRRVTEAFPNRDIIRKIYERACNVLHISIGEGYDTLKEFDIEKFCRTFHYKPSQCRAALRLLHQAGYMEYIEEADRRSRVMMTCRREELYHLRGLTDLAEKTLTRMLRGYTGLFADYVQISEPAIAMSLNITERQVYEALLELGRAKVLSYIPRSRMPLMYLPTSREEPKYIIIGKNIYEDRKEIMRRRTEAMLDYAFNPRICRENRMLEYFGEKRKQRCGRCDVCREQNHRTRHSNGTNLTDTVLEYLRIHPSGTDYRLLERDIRTDRKELGEVIGYLANERYVTIEEGRIRICTDL